MAQEKFTQPDWKVLFGEGVEPQEDLARLKEPGGKYGQGFYPGMPA